MRMLTENVNRRFKRFVESNGKLMFTLGEKLVYSFKGFFIVLDEDCVVCVVGSDGKMLYVSPTVIKGQKRLGLELYSENLSNQAILLNLLKVFENEQRKAKP